MFCRLHQQNRIYQNPRKDLMSLYLRQTELEACRPDVVYRTGQDSAVCLGNAVKKIYGTAVSRRCHTFKRRIYLGLIVRVPVAVCKAPHKSGVVSSIGAVKPFS